MKAGNKPRTLFEKVWDKHLVVPETAEVPAVLYIDLHLIHEVTSPQAFSVLRRAGLRIRRPDLTLATTDHSIPTIRDIAAERSTAALAAARQVSALQDNCKEFGIELYDVGNERQGIVHVIGPELGATQPGKTVVCGDSHTSTHGAFGALAFGIGTTEVGHVLATQCLLQRRPKTMAISTSGRLAAGVSAKDLILAIIGKIGVGGGTGFVLEYRGDAVSALSMEARMTVCNMSIEAGARAGMIAPDDTTFDYLAGRPMAPSGKQWERSLKNWRRLVSDQDARYDREFSLDVSSLAPMITYGTNPGMVMPIDGSVPLLNGDPALRKALDYMRLSPGERLLDKRVDVVFLGSCTNGRLSDLREAAAVMRGQRLADGVRMLAVPGSQAVKKAAEAEGLDKVFIEAGAEWREAGCSMCIAMNGDQVGEGQYAVSTSNRNFEGRQGPGSRTFLASPVTAAAAALTGRVTDPRRLVS